MKYNPTYVWTTLFILFIIFEGVGLFHEWRTHSDSWTLTHYISSDIPISIRVAIIAWLAWHFLVAHKNS